MAMEVYTLDALFRRIEVFDRFESLIWTERWASWGDFQITIFSTYESRSYFKAGTLLSLSHSRRVMRVETVEDTTSSLGVKMLKVKGRSIEIILEDRSAVSFNTATPRMPLATWDLIGVPAGVMRTVVHDICVTGTASEHDRITNLVEARHPDIPADTIAEPIDPIAVMLEPKSVYEVLTNLSNTWVLGFRLLLNDNTGQLYFDVYAGSDRTSTQMVLEPVIFSPELDNLQDTTELQTIEGAKNIAYVISPHGFLEVVAPNVPDDVEDFERSVLTVIASDIPDGLSPEDLELALRQRGKEALSEFRAFQAFDGEINQRSQYLYNRDYYLGDLVETRNQDGVANQMRVSEQIFVSDKTGERAYPTLTLNTFVSTGSWLSWTSNRKWIDYDADTVTTWSVLP